MTPSTCICCGEGFSKQANSLSRNPNICASCSSMVDGMDEVSVAGTADVRQIQPQPRDPVAVENRSIT